MKKGFTLLELVVVIIIIGILATLGFAQYTRMMERARGAEGRSVLGAIRTQAASLWIERSSGPGPTVPAATFVDAAVGIGPSAGQIASLCTALPPSTSYYFEYAIVQNAANNGFTATATRCTAGTGKQPSGATDGTLDLVTDFAAGSDAWTGTGGY